MMLPRASGARFPLEDVTGHCGAAACLRRPGSARAKYQRWGAAGVFEGLRVGGGPTLAWVSGWRNCGSRRTRSCSRAICASNGLGKRDLTEPGGLKGFARLSALLPECHELEREPTRWRYLLGRVVRRGRASKAFSSRRPEVVVGDALPPPNCGASPKHDYPVPACPFLILESRDSRPALHRFSGCSGNCCFSLL